MRPVRGLKLLGFQSLAPEAVGQMSFTVTPTWSPSQDWQSVGPVFRSTPFVELTGPYGSADSTWPVCG